MIINPQFIVAMGQRVSVSPFVPHKLAMFGFFFFFFFLGGGGGGGRSFNLIELNNAAVLYLES